MFPGISKKGKPELARLRRWFFCVALALGGFFSGRFFYTDKIFVVLTCPKALSGGRVILEGRRVLELGPDGAELYVRADSPYVVIEKDGCFPIVLDLYQFFEPDKECYPEVSEETVRQACGGSNHRP